MRKKVRKVKIGMGNIRSIKIGIIRNVKIGIIRSIKVGTIRSIKMGIIRSIKVGIIKIKMGIKKGNILNQEEIKIDIWIHVDNNN